MSRVPVGGVKLAEFGASSIGDELNRVGETSIDTGTDGRNFSNVKWEKAWLRRNVVSKLKITRIIRAKVATIPIKGTEDDFVVDREELMDLFPNLGFRAVNLETFESRTKLTNVLD
jgi:hypothetical protein